MSETREPEDKAARGGRKTMTLGVKRTVEQGHVRQSFSHGRSKSVLVEKKRSKKPLTMQEAVANMPAERPEQAPRPKTGARDPLRQRQQDGGQPERARNVLRQLSANEVDARARALTEARKRQEVERVERAEEEARQVEEAERRAEEARVQAEEDARQAEEAAREEAAQRAVADAEAVEAKTATPSTSAPASQPGRAPQLRPTATPGGRPPVLGRDGRPRAEGATARAGGATAPSPTPTPATTPRPAREGARAQDDEDEERSNRGGVDRGGRKSRRLPNALLRLRKPKISAASGPS